MDKTEKRWEKTEKSRVGQRKLGKTVKNRVKERKKGGRIEDHPVAGETVFYGVTATQAGGRA